MNKKVKIEYLFIVTITILVSFTFGYLINKPIVTNNYNENINYFINNYNHIVDNYYDKIDEKKLINAAIKGIIDSLEDPYSSYLETDNSASFNTSLSGSYIGLGLEVRKTEEGLIQIIRIIEDSPASKIGIKEKGIITKINDQNTTEYELQEFTSYIREQKTKEIKLEITYDEEVKNVVIKNEEIEIKSAKGTIMKPKTGLIKVDLFALNTYSQFKTELEKLEKEGIEHLIIDLRDNTGGHLHSVENILNLFLTKKQILYQTETKTKTEKIYGTAKTNKGYKITLLTNKLTASASEMLVAGLVENLNSNHIGETTFGKGLIQEIKSTNQDQDSYKITTKKWLTPKGNFINEKGIIPNQEIIQGEQYFENPRLENDLQLLEALK